MSLTVGNPTYQSAVEAEVITYVASALNGIVTGGQPSRVGGAMNYAPAAGNVDPGVFVPSFGQAVGRVKVTLAGNTTLAGWPLGADGQQIYFMVVSGLGSVLQLATGAVTGGQPFYASGNLSAGLFDVLQCFYDAPSGVWVVVP